MPRSLAAALRQAVSATSRQRGDAYFRIGRVSTVEASPAVYRALVRGTDAYRVTLRLDSNRLDVSCTCPRALDTGEPCKHVWAAILAADRAKAMAVPNDVWLDVALDLDAAAQPETAEEFFEEFGDALPALDSRAVRRTGHATTVGREPHVPNVRRQPPAPEPWRIFLSNVAPAPSEPAPVQALVTGELIYVFDPGRSAQAGGILIEAYSRDRKKSGDWTKPRLLNIARRDIGALPDPADRDLLHAICGADSAYFVGPGYGYAGYAGASPVPSSFVLNPTLQRELLPRFCATRRLFLRAALSQDPKADAALIPLDWDPVPARFRVRIGRAADAFIVEGDVLRDGVACRFADVMFVTSTIILWGPADQDGHPRFAGFDVAGGERWLNQLLTARSVTIPAAEAELLAEILVIGNLACVDVPEELRVDVSTESPQPMLRLTRDHRVRGYYAPDGRVAAHLSFRYRSTEIDANETLPVIFDRPTRSAWRRDSAAERSAAARLQSLGVRRLADWQNGGTRLDLAEKVMPTLVRVLIREGWRVEADGQLYRHAGQAALEVRSGIDWFEVHGHVDFDGVRAPFPELLAAIRRGDGFVTLADGTLGMLTEEWAERYGRVMSMGTAADGYVRFTPAQAALLDAWLDSQPDVTIDEAFAAARRQLARFEGIAPAAPPDTFNGTLRDYQREALGWFAFLRQFGFGGCLADEMGLGKTIMVLAALEARRVERTQAGDPVRPSLVVVPRSLVFNWQREAARFTPHLRVLDFTHGKRREAIHDIALADLVLTTYGTLRRDIGDLKGIAFDYVILDEAQAIKNARTSSAKAVRLLDARHRLALSGTPIENHLRELWSLFEFLNPGVLGGASAFASASTAGGPADNNALDLLRRALRPFILRRTKEQVAKELPARTEQTLYCDLEPVQRSLYDELRDHYRTLLLTTVARAGLGRSKLQILEALLRLRQAACHPGLLDRGRPDATSAKFDMLVPRLQELVEDGRKVLVFSQFTTLLGLLRPRLDDVGIAYEYLDGQTPDRQSKVDRFQQGACPVFLISLKAGGVGLNLTAAEYVFLLDPWWNPATEAQAIDRAHRIGQTRPVFAYRLIARDTVEEKVLELQASKRALADAIIRADDGVMRELRREDLELLLS